MISRLQKQATTPNFKLNMPQQEISRGLNIAYEYIVKQRQCVYIKADFVLNYIEIASEWLSGNFAKCFLMLSGLPGTGKTTLAKTICELINAYFDDDIYTENIGVVQCDSIEIEESFKEDNLKTFPKKHRSFDLLKETTLLFIDDLGTEQTEVKIFGSQYKPIIDLLSYRYEKRLITIITTNLTPKEIRSRYGERIYSRFQETAKVIAFNEHSFRVKDA